MKIMLGGGVDQFGEGSVAQKVATIPTKRTLEAVGLILDDFETNAEENEFFNNYFQRKTEIYFDDLLKSVSDLSSLKEGEQRDWGEVVDYEKPVPRQRVKPTDLIQDLMTESTIRFEKADVLIEEGHFNDAVIHVYNAYVRIAKAMLLHVSIECGTQISLLTTFDEQFVADNKLSLSIPALKEYVLSYKTIEINKEFAMEYLQTARLFHAECKRYLEN